MTSYSFAPEISTPASEPKTETRTNAEIQKADREYKAACAPLITAFSDGNISYTEVNYPALKGGAWKGEIHKSLVDQAKR